MISLLPSSNAHVHKVINISVKTNCNTCRLAVHKETRDKAVDCFMPPDALQCLQQAFYCAVPNGSCDDNRTTMTMTMMMTITILISGFHRALL